MLHLLADNIRQLRISLATKVSRLREWKAGLTRTLDLRQKTHVQLVEAVHDALQKLHVRRQQSSSATPKSPAAEQSPYTSELWRLYGFGELQSLPTRMGEGGPLALELFLELCSSEEM